MSTIARTPGLVGSYCKKQIERKGGTPLEMAIAFAIGTELAANHGSAEISTVALRAVCAQRDVVSEWGHTKGRAPSYGSITRVLEMLRSIGVIAWAAPHVLRYCKQRVIQDGRASCDHSWEPHRPIRHADGGFRLPIRKLALVGFAATMAATLIASGADSIDRRSRAKHQEMRASRAAIDEAETRSSSIPKTETTQAAPQSLSSQSARDAAPVTAADWRRAREKLQL